MKGFRFYADIPGTESEPVAANGFYADNIKPAFGPRTTIKQLREASEKNDRCNCIALFIGREHRCNDGTQECLAAVTAAKDSGVNLTSVDTGYLRKCRRIPETLARKLHPALFARLDD